MFLDTVQMNHDIVRAITLKSAHSVHTASQRKLKAKTQCVCVCVPPLCPSPPHLTPRDFHFPKLPLSPNTSFILDSAGPPPLAFPWSLKLCTPPHCIHTHTHTLLHGALLQPSAAPYTSPSVKHSPSCCPLSPCSAE